MPLSYPSDWQRRYAVLAYYPESGPKKTGLPSHNAGWSRRFLWVFELFNSLLVSGFLKFSQCFYQSLPEVPLPSGTWHLPHRCRQ